LDPGSLLVSLEVTRKASKEAAPFTGMAGRPGLLNLDKKCVLIAIEKDFLYFLDMTRCFTLLPEFLT